MATRGERRGWLTPAARGRVLLLLTLFVPLLGAVPGGRWAVPVAAPLTVYVWFSRRVRLGDYFGAWKLGMAWAGLLSLGVILLVALAPATAAGAVLHGPAYKTEMFGWVTTGIAPENSPRLFLPQHLLHLSLFLVLTWVSGGYLGLVLGTFLVDYMSFFVGSYAVAIGHPVTGVLAAWVPWSVLRVASFVLLGAVFARPLLERRVWPMERRERILLLLAASGIVGDALVKALLAPHYGLFLRQLAGGSL
jgi:hypothetical protein